MDSIDEHLIASIFFLFDFFMIKSRGDHAEGLKNFLFVPFFASCFLNFLDHLAFNVGQSNGDIRLTTSFRLFWNH